MADDVPAWDEVQARSPAISRRVLPPALQETDLRRNSLLERVPGHTAARGAMSRVPVALRARPRRGHCKTPLRPACEDHAIATIDEALDEFLAAEKARLAPSTYARYADIVSLLRDHVNGYAYLALSRAEQRRWEQASDAGEGEGAYCAIFGPERIPGEIGSFLGYFMVRKVIAGAELLKAAGTVTKKLARWLHEHGYIDAETAADVTEQAADAARDLPAAARLSDLLSDVSMRPSPAGIDEDSVIEDTLVITRIEPGKLWFGGHGPVTVPKQASDIAQLGWEVYVALVDHRGRWWLLENGAVYP